MRLSTLLAKCNRKVLIALTAGSVLMQFNFNGCNPDLRNQVIAGLNTAVLGLVSTFINAFFQSLTSTTSSSQPIVQVILDHLPRLA